MQGAKAKKCSSTAVLLLGDVQSIGLVQSKTLRHPWYNGHVLSDKYSDFVL